MKLEKEKIIRELKSEKGSITVFVLSTMLLVTGVIFVSYFNMMNKNSSQLAELNKIQEEYLQTSDISAMDQAYDEAYNPSTVSTLKAGDYVSYEDKNGTIRKCMVLWDESSEYGIQIITIDSVGDVTLGSRNVNEAIASYNNAITTLNNEAMKYLNTTYASDARCVGSVPNNKNSESGMYTNSELGTYSGIMKNGDTNYQTDWNQMGILEIKTGECWLASRYISIEPGTMNFGIYHNSEDIIMQLNGTLVKVRYNEDNGTTIAFVEPETYGLRPVFTLKPEVKLVGGSGTEGDPYILGI